MIIKPVKTNVITGFLGVGKTTLIRQLLAHKPPGEVWAVLVNEFGEIGIDGSLLDAFGIDRNDVTPATNKMTPQVVIKEVAGGCLCCASNLPTQVAINQLIQQAKPDRLLIEPTGLGHPAAIIKLLQAEHYQHVIELQTSLCLVDARKVSDSRYHAHETFIQQLQIADLLVANKAQLYTENDKVQLSEFLEQLKLQQTPLLTVDNHFTDIALIQQILDRLNMPTTQRLALSTEAPRNHSSRLLGGAPLLSQWFTANVSDAGIDIDADELAQKGFIHKTNQGEGCFSAGWILPAERYFDFECFMGWVNTVKSLAVLRLKAIVITTDGILSVNMVDDHLILDELDDALDSRIEIIGEALLDNTLLQKQLMACLSM